MTVILYFLLICILAICLYIFCYFRKYYDVEEKLKWLPSVPGWPVIGCALEFGDNTQTIHDFERLTKKYGKILYLNIIMEPNIITTDYDFVEYILSTQDVLAKSSDYRFLHRWLGTGLLTSDGLKWKKRRKMATPAFHFSILEQFIDVFERNLDILISKLQKEVEKDINVYPFINLFSLDVICETAMGVSINAQSQAKLSYVDHVKEMCRISLERAFSVAKKNDYLYVFYPDFYKEKKLIRSLHSVTNSVIDARRREMKLNLPESVNDKDDVGRKRKMAFLDVLLQSTIDGKPLSREDIREEVDTLMFEGHDTTSSAAGFILHLLAMHPEVQNRAVEEQKHIFAKDVNRNSNYQDLQSMKYLEMIIKESLRLYPPVPMYGRLTTQDIQFKGNIIPKGVNIAILSYSILRDPDNFEHPEKFDPERFVRNDGSRPYSYIPFSAGPRNCIGQKFAMLELKSTLSRMLRNFEILPPTSEQKLVLVAEAVLKSKNGIMLKLVKRKW